MAELWRIELQCDLPCKPFCQYPDAPLARLIGRQAKQGWEKGETSLGSPPILRLTAFASASPLANQKRMGHDLHSPPINGQLPMSDYGLKHFPDRQPRKWYRDRLLMPSIWPTFPLADCVSIGYTPAMSGKDSGFRIRVERPLHEQFLQVCRSNDRPASQVLREFMRDYVARNAEDAERTSERKSAELANK